MGDVLVWKTAEEIMKILASESAMVAGMSIEEAALAYGYTLTKSGMYVKTVVDTAAVAGSAATAGEAIAGVAATGGATTTAANLTLYTTTSGTTAVGAIGSVALPIAACCLAGAAGYKLGNITGDMIDKAYPDFFNGLFQSVSEFVTGDKYGLAYVFTADGEVYMPEASKGVIDEYLKKQLDLSITSETKVDDLNITFHKFMIGLYITCSFNTSKNNVTYVQVTNISSTSPVYCFAYYTEGGYQINWCAFSKESFSYDVRTVSRKHEDGSLVSETSSTRTCTTLIRDFYAVLSGGIQINLLSEYSRYFTIFTNSISSLPTQEPLFDAIQNILNGDFTSNSQVPSELTKIEIPYQPSIKVPSPYPSWSPVKLPSTLPNKFPTEFPTLDPDGAVDPSRVTPYIPQPQPYPENIPVVNPTPNPNPIVVPQPTLQPFPQPAPSPEIDPSVEPAPNPNPVTKPTPIPTPEDSGSTPKPPTPVIPPISSSASGLLHVYNPTSEQVNEFGAWLWTTFSGDLIDTLAKLFNNPMDAVIGLHELYCTPSTGSSTTIKAGFLDSGVTSRLVSQRYTEINCGAITVPEYWGNYLDYAPYTKVYCYLPFIGIVELNTDDIMGHGVQIVYKIDTYNGSCIAMIITAKKQDEESVTYQFSGNCAVEVPITSGMKSAIQSALIGAATAAIGASAAGVVSKGMLAAAGVNGAAQHGLNGKNSVSHSGSFGSSYGAMGIKKPYIIVKRPVQKVVHGYNKNYGYPAHKMVTIGDCSGYLRCRDFEVKSSTATEEEKKRIEILLKEGVYV